MRHKDDVVTQYDFVSAEWVRPFYRTDEDGPSEAWIQGWEANMHGGLEVNPFGSSSQEAIDWQDGWDAAERD
jgi:hypothetical protein